MFTWPLISNHRYLVKQCKFYLVYTVYFSYSLPVFRREFVAIFKCKPAAAQQRTSAEKESKRSDVQPEKTTVNSVSMVKNDEMLPSKLKMLSKTQEKISNERVLAIM